MKFINYALVVVLILALTWFVSLDIEDRILDQNHYCEMVRDYKASNGDSGWPDYDNKFDEACK